MRDLKRSSLARHSTTCFSSSRRVFPQLAHINPLAILASGGQHPAGSSLSVRLRIRTDPGDLFKRRENRSWLNS